MIRPASETLRDKNASLESKRQVAETRASSLEMRLQSTEAQKTDLLRTVATANGQITELNEQVRKSLNAYILHYRNRLADANVALSKYTEFDNETNRKEIAPVQFEKRQTELLTEARVKIKALVEHVERWRPLLKPFQESLNGRVNAVKTNLNGDVQDLLGSFKALRQTAQSNMDLFQRTLDDIAKMQVE